MPVSNSSNFAEDMATYVRAGCQAFFVTATGEEARAEMNLIEVAEKLSSRKRMHILFWDAVQGFTGLVRKDALVVKDGNKFKDIQLAMKFIVSSEAIDGDVLFVFRDAHPYLSKVPEVRRCFLNLRVKNQFCAAGQWRRPIVFLSGSRDIHPEIQNYVTEMRVPKPDESQLERTFEQVANQVGQMLKGDPAGTCSPALRNRLLLGLLGMTDNEAETVLYFCAQRHKGFREGMLDTLEEEKARVLGNSRVLTYIPKSKISGMEQLGGFDNLLEFVRARKLAYTPEARNASLEYPRGLVLIGPPGTAKSVCGKAVARELDLPLVILDYSAVKGALVGESENRLKEALEQVRAIKGSVLLIDEFDKAAQGQGDNTGVSQAMMGILLTWLAERPVDDRTFVIPTMNRTIGISPESLRAGRFDRVFHTSFPSPAERWAIFGIHCRKRGIDPLIYGLKESTAFSAATEGFTGAEIEQALKDARFNAFAKRKDGAPAMEEILEECGNLPTVKKLDPENVAAIEEFCRKAGTYSVSKVAQQASTAQGKQARSKRDLDLGSWN